MAATSPWTPPQTKSPHWSKDLSVLHAKALRRGEQGEAAFERDGAQQCIGFEPFNRKVAYVGQENSNHNRRIGWYRRRFSRGFLIEGYNVVATSRHANRESTTSGALVLLDGDIGKQQTAAYAVDAAINNFGTVDVLVDRY
jgi:hypothetical protein